MVAATEIADAYIALYTKMPGVGKDIGEALGGSEVEGAVEEAGKKQGGFFGGALAKTLTGAAVVAGIVGAFKGLYEVGSVFDDVSDTIRVGTGATGDALRDLEQAAKDVATSVPADFAAAGQTVADLNTRLGLSGDTLTTVAEQYLEAGRILGEDVDISTTTGLFNAFKIEGEDVSSALDHLFQVSQATGIGINELASQTQTAAPLVQNLGLSFEETSALIGTLDKAGLDSNRMLSSLSAGMVNLARSGEDPADAFQRVVGELDDLIASGDTASAIDLAGGIFGTRGAAQFVGAVQSGSLALDDLVGAAHLSGDTILGVGAETQDFAESWQIVQNNAMAALEPLGSAVFSTLGDALSSLLPTLQDFGEWLSDNQWVIGVVTAALGVLATAILVALVPSIVAWTASIWAANVALFANPITWIVLGIVALIAAIILLVMNWDQVVAWITDIWAGFVGWLSDGLNGLAGWWNDLWAGIFGWAQSLWQGYVDWVLGIFLGFLGFMQDVGRNLTSFWSDLWSGLGGIVRDVWNGIVGFIEDAVNGVIGLINGMIGGVNDIGGNFGIHIGKIPKVNFSGVKLAQGAIVEHVRGGVPATLGEGRYDEIVQPLGGPQFDRLADALAAKLAAAGGNVFNLPPTDPHVLAKLIARELKG